MSYTFVEKKTAGLPNSPCLGYCTTALGDDICKACGRTFVEVNDWIIMTPEERDKVWVRLLAEGWEEKRRSKITSGRNT
jgi:predicted Fe-S protein YdhL (DUF1289 family)